MRMLSLTSLAVMTTLLTAPFANAANQYEFSADSQTAAKHIAIFVDEDGTLSPLALAANAKTGGQLEETLQAADFKGAFGKSLRLYGMGPYTSITVIGSGDEKLTMRSLRDLGGYAEQASLKDKSLAVMADGLNTQQPDASAQMAAGFALSSYAFNKYKTDAKDIDRTVSFISSGADGSQKLFNDDLKYLVTGVDFARDMGTEPGKSMYPEAFGQRVKDMFKGVPSTSVQVLGVSDMKRYNMGALMGVGQGSIHDPKLVIVTYNGGKSGDAPLALVGKGITFDTGGISIKPNTNQWMMKADLSGAAAVAGAVYAAAQRGEKINLVGVMAMAENMPARDAIRPGDVLETMSGKTIEVISTDAEGRLVLADAVRYTQDKFNPELLLDIATLTGSASRALGDDYAAVVTRDWGMAEALMALGKDAGEDVWPLPLNEAHFKAIESDIADIKGSGGNPGVSIGAAVIGTFIDDDQPWVHLDIAGVDWRSKSTPTTPKGHTGWGVRFMDALVRDTAAKK